MKTTFSPSPPQRCHQIVHLKLATAVVDTSVQGGMDTASRPVMLRQDTMRVELRIDRTMENYALLIIKGSRWG